VTGRGITDSSVHRDAAFQLAQADPLAAARALARGLRGQTVGAKVAVVRLLADALEQQEPGIRREIAAALHTEQGV
jgi:hypothetical protein